MHTFLHKKVKIVNLIEENTEYLHTWEVNKDFLVGTPKTLTIKEKIYRLNFIKLKTLFLIKMSLAKLIDCSQRLRHGGTHL
jgi:hypothetical protein